MILAWCCMSSTSFAEMFRRLGPRNAVPSPSDVSFRSKHFELMLNLVTLWFRMRHSADRRCSQGQECPLHAEGEIPKHAFKQKCIKWERKPWGIIQQPGYIAMAVFGCINIFCWHKPMFVVDKTIEPSTPSASASHISRLRTPLETDWSKSFLLRRCFLSCRGNDCLALHLEPTSPLSSLLSNKNTSTWRDSKEFHWLEGAGILPFSKDKSK